MKTIFKVFFGLILPPILILLLLEGALRLFYPALMAEPSRPPFLTEHINLRPPG